MIHGGHFQAHLDDAVGVLTGHPVWKAYQNRILGPGIVAGMAWLSHLSFPVCYKLFCFAMLCLANFVCYFLFYKHAERRSVAWAYTVAYAATFVFFQDHTLLYLWDYIDFVVLMIFAWMVVVGEFAFWQIIALYALELLNRESAQFIALWIVIDSVQFTRSATLKSKLTINFARLFTGVALGVAGSSWTVFIRNKLIVQPTGVGGPDLNGSLGGQWFTLPHTFRLMKDTSALSPASILILLGVLTFFVWRGWPRLGQRAWKIAALACAITAANLCFATVLEMRVWFTILPLLPWLVYVVQTHAPNDNSALPGGFRQPQRLIEDHAGIYDDVTATASRRPVSNGAR